MCSVAFVIFAVLCWGAVSCEQPQSRLVELLPQGPVRGYRDTKYGIYAFYDIPYAKAPTGLDRFKGPLPPPVWSEVFEAVDRVIMCPQTDKFDMLPAKRTMQEDCLTASVYVPETKEKNLPVVVYVHGGAYIAGWGNLATPKNFVKSKKVIAVTFNHRLGAHGFLCLGTEHVPGNAGMKDQVALLRWVKNNIAKFGGNPDEVTIAGYSAGSSSVDLLMISKLTDNLFKRVIPESGANIAAFSIQVDPIKSAKEYALLLTSKHFEDLNALEKFYQTVSYEQLNSAKVINRKDSNFYMAPCVERDLGEEMFLDDSPVNILRSGNFKKVPMLYGFANMEGLFRMPFFNHWKNLMNEKFSDFLPADLKFESETEKEQVAEKVKRFYFGEKPINEESVLAYIDYFTDVLFAYSTLKSVKLQLEAGNNQIYLYEYTYYDDDTPPVPYTNNIRGANHCAQTHIVLDGLYNSTETNISDDLKTHTKIMREIWLNFMITGMPIPEDSKLPTWRPVGAGWSPYMSLGRTLQLKDSLLKERTLFWDGIYEKYYFNPIPPISPLEHTEL
ncbi:para-nitrobenzyl esterase-like [Maniola hyperantus]|uniref:para-nitrobenzyl esterase-like n=1 Tax=Aphantopus hyperantus TaxID=2795564 RepID=UPI001567F5A5|nr:para-nitrobenzyl esterase-like [Maniola hyperantus]